MEVYQLIASVLYKNMSLLLKNKSENMPPKTAPPTANEEIRVFQKILIGNICFGLFSAKIPVLNVVSTKHRSHFLPNSSSLGLLGAILNPVRACKIFAQSQSRPQSPRYPCPAERENEVGEVFVFPFRWTRVTRALGTRLASIRNFNHIPQSSAQLSVFHAWLRF